MNKIMVRGADGTMSMSSFASFRHLHVSRLVATSSLHHLIRLMNLPNSIVYTSETPALFIVSTSVLEAGWTLR